MTPFWAPIIDKSWYCNNVYLEIKNLLGWVGESP